MKCTKRKLIFKTNITHCVNNMIVNLVEFKISRICLDSLDLTHSQRINNTPMF